MTLAQIVKNSNNIVFFGGAGVSTESGVPDFRSEAGLYSAQEKYGHAPEFLLSRECFLKMPELFFQYYKENMIHLDAKPNTAHDALARLEQAGKLSLVITQNIDGLHQAAGSKNVCELHGANAKQYCVNCKKRYSLEYVIDPMNCDVYVPKCEVCSGTVRPDVVLYGEGLNDAVVSRALGAIEATDCLIVGGTSLSVYPAAGLVSYAPPSAKIILINKGKTAYDDDYDLVIRDSIGKVFAELIDEVL